MNTVHAQDVLKRFTVTPSSSQGRTTVFLNYPDKAGIIVQSALTNLSFESNMDGIVNERQQPEQGQYVLVIEPVAQIITINAQGYMQERLRISGISAKDVRYYVVEPEAEAEAATIPVNFQVTPEDAEVVVYGENVEGEVVDIRKPVPMIAGDYRIVFRKSGYQTIEKEFSISELSNFVQQDLSEIEQVGILILTNPPESMVFLDGVQIGQTDAEGGKQRFIFPGTYELVVQKSGYISDTRQVTFTETGQNRVEIELERNIGMLQLQVEPDDATIWINRESIQQNKLLELSPGIHRIEIERQGYEPYAETFEIVRGETTVRNIALQAYVGTLQITTNPISSRWVLSREGGEMVESGVGMARIRDVLVGNYVMEVTATGHKLQEERLEIRRDETVNLAVVLEESTDIQKPVETKILESKTFNKDNLENKLSIETEVVDVVNPETGVTWMDRNLGASRVARSSTDPEGYGDLYQWGRGADGHEKRTSGTTSTLSSSDQPAHGDFITTSSGPFDWRSPQNDNLWQGVDGVNNPCPVGYRLPTVAEWEAEIAIWSSNNNSGAYSSPLKLPVAGRRLYGDGSLGGVGSGGYYWSSSVDGSNARLLLFGSGDAYMYSYTRAYGFSVRCLED